jgi:hypothetical protein
MCKWFRDLFSESSDVSMTRFLSFICVTSALGIAVTGVIRGSDVTALCTVFLSAGLGAKVWQRSIEAKESQNEK